LVLNGGILDNNADDSDPSWMIGLEYRIPVVFINEFLFRKRLDQNCKQLLLLEHTLILIAQKYAV